MVDRIGNEVEIGDTASATGLLSIPTLQSEGPFRLVEADGCQVDVLHQGAVKVASVRTVAKGENVVALEVQLEDKGACIYYTGSAADAPLVALHSADSEKPLQPTRLTFPQFLGWDVFAAGVGRYTLSVCLVLFADKKIETQVAEEHLSSLHPKPPSL